jgi:hypothetical protein
MSALCRKTAPPAESLVATEKFREEAIMSVAQASHFKQAFDISYAIQIIVSTSVRTGIPVDGRRVVAMLCARFPDAKEAPEAVERALLLAAQEADATIRTNEVATAPAARAA